MNIKIDPVEYDNIAKLYKDGKTQKEISIIYGVAESVINRILKQLGVEAHRKIPISEYDNIIQLYEGGKTQKEIGDIYGVANNTISQLLKKLGVTTNRKIPHSEYENISNEYLSGKSPKQIAETYNVSVGLIRYILEQTNTPMKGRSKARRKYEFNENYFDEIDTPNKAYILGLMAADGCNCNGTFSIGLKEDDVDILKKIQSEVSSTHPLYYRKARQQTDILNDGRKIEHHSPMYYLQIRSVHACEMLSKYGIIPNKTYSLQFPEWLEPSLLPHYIRGYLDGDGSICRQKNDYAVRFYGQKCFLDKLKEHLENTLDVEMKLREHGTIYVLYVYRKEWCKKILNYLYKDAELYLDRKYEIYQSKYV